jgi:hypothetical protein
MSLVFSSLALHAVPTEVRCLIFRRMIGARRTVEQIIGGYPHQMGARTTSTFELFCTFLMCITVKMALALRFDVCEYTSDLFSRHIKQGVMEDWMVTCFFPCFPSAIGTHSLNSSIT